MRSPSSTEDDVRLAWPVRPQRPRAARDVDRRPVSETSTDEVTGFNGYETRIPLSPKVDRFLGVGESLASQVWRVLDVASASSLNQLPSPALMVKPGQVIGTRAWDTVSIDLSDLVPETSDPVALEWDWQEVVLYSARPTFDRVFIRYLDPDAAARPWLERLNTHFSAHTRVLRGIDQLLGVNEAPCEALFEQLAASAPDRLLALIESNTLKPTDLTYAAEIAGRIKRTHEVIRILRPLLNNSSALVREGAVYGLAHHLSNDVRQELQSLATEDPSPGVRAAASDVLDQ